MDKSRRPFKSFPESEVRKYLTSRYRLSPSETESVVRGVMRQAGNRALTKVGLKSNIDGFLLAWLRHHKTGYDKWIDLTTSDREYRREKNIFNEEAFEKREAIKKKE